MARLFDDASSQSLDLTSAVATQEPITMAAWFRTDDLTVSQTIISVGRSGGTTGSYSMQFSGGIANDPLRAVKVNDAGTIGVGNNANGVQQNIWHHGAVRFISNTDRNAVLDLIVGTSVAPGNVVDPTGLDRTNIGIRRNSVDTLPFSGRIAFPTIWNVLLTDQEIFALARGKHPFEVRPLNIVGGWELHGWADPEIGLIEGTSLTVSGPTRANGPPVQPYSKRFWGGIPLIEVSGASFQAAWARNTNTLLGGGIP